MMHGIPDVWSTHSKRTTNDLVLIYLKSTQRNKNKFIIQCTPMNNFTNGQRIP